MVLLGGVRGGVEKEAWCFLIGGRKKAKKDEAEQM